MFGDPWNETIPMLTGHHNMLAAFDGFGPSFKQPRHLRAGHSEQYCSFAQIDYQLIRL